MILLDKPRAQTDLAHGKFSTTQKYFRVFNPPVENVLIGTLIHALPEGPAEVKEAHRRLFRKRR